MEAIADANANPSLSSPDQLQDCSERNAQKALIHAREGKCGSAIRILGSNGYAAHDDTSALEDIRCRHPCHHLYPWSDTHPIPQVVDTAAVLDGLRSFPKGTSPGSSKLRVQHLLDAITGTISPLPGACLDQLAYLINKMLSGKLDRRIAPWLCGAPLTALRKKSSCFRPISVGDVFRRLASKLCCSAVRPSLLNTFLPYGQVGVGIKGDLEVAVHGVRKILEDCGHDEKLCCVKVDMKNAFNECHRVSFLQRV